VIQISTKVTQNAILHQLPSFIVINTRILAILPTAVNNGAEGEKKTFENFELDSFSFIRCT
jgi:hypothetical protein